MGRPRSPSTSGARFVVPRPVRGAAVVVLLGLAAVAVPALAQTQPPAVITIRPDCGDPAPGANYNLAVVGANFSSAVVIIVTFDAAAGGKPEAFQGRTDTAGRFTMVITPTRRPAGSYLVRAADSRQRQTTVAFPVPCPGSTTTSSSSSIPDTTTSSTTSSTTTTTTAVTFRPVLRMEPPIGPPGFVPFAVGSGFPPGAAVTLAWAPGITAPPTTPVAADASGNFRVPVLVFHRDRLGPRQLNATPGGGAAFTPAAAPFLVVPGKLQPGDFVDRR